MCKEETNKHNSCPTHQHGSKHEYASQPVHQHAHSHTVYEEIVCHLPYAIFASAFSLAILSFVSVGQTNMTRLCTTAHGLFHAFHFMHIVFAATGALITFFRFSQNKFHAVLLGIFCPMIFCTLSDAIIPYFSGILMGVPMAFHLCFLTEWRNVLPFLLVGLVNGFILNDHHEDRRELYSLFSHVIHILVSSLASLFYLVAYGCTNWLDSIGVVFLFLIIAVVVPCTLSDIVLPMILAQIKRKDG